ncbi:MAG: hypothetical protein AB7P37_07105 [Ramlibacter sp.]
MSVSQGGASPICQIVSPSTPTRVIAELPAHATGKPEVLAAQARRTAGSDSQIGAPGTAPTAGQPPQSRLGRPPQKPAEPVTFTWSDEHIQIHDLNVAQGKYTSTGPLGEPMEAEPQREPRRETKRNSLESASDALGFAEFLQEQEPTPQAPAKPSGLLTQPGSATDSLTIQQAIRPSHARLAGWTGHDAKAARGFMGSLAAAADSGDFRALQKPVGNRFFSANLRKAQAKLLTDLQNPQTVLLKKLWDQIGDAVRNAALVAQNKDRPDSARNAASQQLSKLYALQRMLSSLEQHNLPEFRKFTGETQALLPNELGQTLFALVKAKEAAQSALLGLTQETPQPQPLDIASPDGAGSSDPAALNELKKVASTVSARIDDYGRMLRAAYKASQDDKTPQLPVLDLVKAERAFNVAATAREQYNDMLEADSGVYSVSDLTQANKAMESALLHLSALMGPIARSLS